MPEFPPKMQYIWALTFSIYFLNKLFRKLFNKQFYALNQTGFDLAIFDSKLFFWENHSWAFWGDELFLGQRKFLMHTLVIFIKGFRSKHTRERDLSIAVHALLLSAVFIWFGAPTWPLHVSEVLSPSLSTCIFFQSFLFCSSVLKPDLRRNMG